MGLSLSGITKGALGFSGLSIAGSTALGLGDSAINYFGQEEENRANKHESQRNRDFQERMSNTQHQRQVEDLRLAGLNPILSATSGAGTPTGSMAAPQKSSAIAARRGFNEQRLLTSQVNQISADTKNKDQLALRTAEEITNVKEQRKAIVASARATELDNIGRQQAADFYRDNPLAKKIKMWIDSLSGGSGVLSNVVAGTAGAVGGAALTKKGKKKGGDYPPKIKWKKKPRDKPEPRGSHKSKYPWLYNPGGIGGTK